MPKADLWNRSVSRVELDQRVRDARLRFERLERLACLACSRDGFAAEARPLSF